MPLETVIIPFNMVAIKIGKCFLPKFHAQKATEEFININEKAEEPKELKESVMFKHDSQYFKISGLELGQHCVYVKPSTIRAIV